MDIILIICYYNELREGGILMETIYTLNNGKKVLVSWKEYTQPGDIFARYHELREDGSYCNPTSRRIKLQKERKTNRIYFVMNGEKKYVDEFDYDPVDTLIERINNSKSTDDLKDCEILATFLKDTDNVGLILQLVACSWILEDGQLIPLCPKHVYSDPMLCVPTERNYKKRNWYEAITLEPENRELRNRFLEDNYLFKDFCLQLRDGIIKLVNKNKYKDENNSKVLRKIR